VAALMASMRRLKRRLQVWQRYADATYQSERHTGPSWGVMYLPGHARAIEAVNVLYRRRTEDRGRDDERCCNVGAEGHDGPCVWDCGMCQGGGDCIGCDGDDDLGCDECGGALCCWYCGGEGEVVDSSIFGPSIVTEDAFAQLELL
jgi:hypothetical protein